MSMTETLGPDTYPFRSNRRLFRKATFSPAQPRLVLHPARPESAKTDSLPWDTPSPQARPQQATQDSSSKLAWLLYSGDGSDEFPTARTPVQPLFVFSRVAWSILDCARRTSTFRACALREHRGFTGPSHPPLADFLNSLLADFFTILLKSAHTMAKPSA